MIHFFFKFCQFIECTYWIHPSSGNDTECDMFLICSNIACRPQQITSMVHAIKCQFCLIHRNKTSATHYLKNKKQIYISCSTVMLPALLDRQTLHQIEPDLKFLSLYKIHGFYSDKYEFYYHSTACIGWCKT